MSRFKFYQTKSRIDLGKAQTLHGDIPVFCATLNLHDRIHQIYKMHLLPAAPQTDWIRLFGLPIEELELFEEFIDKRENYIDGQGYRKAWIPTAAKPSVIPVSHVVEPTIDWHEDPTKVLLRLGSTDADELETAVLFAENLDFGLSVGDLLERLERFISDNRFVSDNRRLTVLAAAIRKFAMNMNQSMFEQYAHWLSPSTTDTIAPETELELVQAISWRLMYQPVELDSAFPTLESNLSGIIDAYLSPRLMLQKCYASVVLAAVIDIFLLTAISRNQTSLSDLLHRIRTVGLEWFHELLKRRLEAAVVSLEKSDREFSSRLQLAMKSFTGS